VIVRLRGRTDLGSTLTETLARYADALLASGSKLVIISDHERVLSQLAIAGVVHTIGSENVYRSDEWLGRTMRRAHADAEAWIAAQPS